MNVQFLSNEKGKKTAVVVPIKEWEKIQEQLNKKIFFISLSKSVHEMKLMQEGKLSKPKIDLFND